MTTMKRLTAGIVSLTMACTMMFAPVEAGSESFCSPAVITASAADSTYKPGQRSGSHRAYISHIGIKSNAVTICGNSDADVEDTCDWLYDLSLNCSGGKPASYVIKAGKLLVGGYAPGQAILTVFDVIFTNMGNVSSAAANARKELMKLMKEHPLQGYKLTIKENGAWVCELQPADKNLEKRYNDYIKSQQKTVCVAAVKYYPAVSSKYRSIVDALKSIGVNSSFANRKKIYDKNQLYKSYGQYSGSAKQNTALLKLLQGGRCVKV